MSWWTDPPPSPVHWWWCRHGDFHGYRRQPAGADAPSAGLGKPRLPRRGEVLRRAGADLRHLSWLPALRGAVRGVLLEHNGIPYILVEKERCCGGMPRLELGGLGAVQAAQEAHIPVLARHAREGCAILAAVPPLRADVQAGAAADVPRGRRHPARQGTHGGPVRVPDGAPARRPGSRSRWAR